MNTKQRIQQALTEAMRNRDELRKRVLRLALLAIKMAEVEKGGELDEAALAAVLQ
ncbi:GatB/YqeY domain-containing protein, partial [Candidatus Parcubacteria bacterium]